MKKVLILTISNGDAYNVAGRAIVNGIASRYPSVNFRMVDVSKGNKGINFQLSQEQTLSQKLAHKLERHRYICCKETEDVDKARKLAGVYLKSIREYIKYNISTFEPNVIIATHAFPAIVLSELRESGWQDISKTRLAYVECNYVVSPYIKIAKNLDYYFSPTEDAIRTYKKYGIKDGNKIINFGIPIVSQIENVTSQEEARELLNIPQDKYVVLVTNGENQSDHTLGLIKSLLGRYSDVFVVCMCNKNINLRNKLTKYIKAKNIKNVKVIGHSNNLGVLLSACNVVMGKTVGVEVAQAIAKGLPYISTLKAKGQELDNLKYLKKKNVILNGRTIGSAMTALDNIKKNGKVCKTMILQASKIYKHNATDEIIKFLYHNQKTN